MRQSSMPTEPVAAVEMTPRGELLIRLESGGKPEYVHVYREAAGVYWEPDAGGFRSTPIREWNHSRWYAQIVSVVKSSFGVSLAISPNTTWSEIPENERQEIQALASEARTLCVDCSGVTSSEDFWARYAQQIESESARYFGRNLDAFWDAMSRGGPGYPNAQTVVLKNSVELKSIQAGKFALELQRISEELKREEHAVQLALE